MVLLERIEDEGLRRDIGVYLDWCQLRGARITFVLETHIHADYASGARALAQQTGPPGAGPGRQHTGQITPLEPQDLTTKLPSHR